FCLRVPTAVLTFTRSLHDALPISRVTGGPKARARRCAGVYGSVGAGVVVVCSVIGPSYGLSRWRGSGLRESSAGAAPLRCARLPLGTSTTPDAAQWRGSDLNGRSPGNEPGEDSAPLPRSMRRGFTRSGAPGAASAPTGRRSAAVVVVVGRMYETTFVCTYRQELRKRRAERSLGSGTRYIAAILSHVL